MFTQICGRLRDSKYKDEIIHVYSTTKYSRDVTLDEFVASTKKVLAEAVSYADEINKLSDTAREKTLSKIKYINEQYVRIEDNRLIVDKNFANMDIVNFKICRHIYRTSVRPYKLLSKYPTGKGLGKCSLKNLSSPDLSERETGRGV